MLKIESIEELSKSDEYSACPWVELEIVLSCSEDEEISPRVKYLCEDEHLMVDLNGDKFKTYKNQILTPMGENKFKFNCYCIDGPTTRAILQELRTYLETGDLPYRQQSEWQVLDFIEILDMLWD